MTNLITTHVKNPLSFVFLTVQGKNMKKVLHRNPKIPILHIFSSSIVVSVIIQRKLLIHDDATHPTFEDDKLQCIIIKIKILIAVLF